MGVLFTYWVALTWNYMGNPQAVLIIMGFGKAPLGGNGVSAILHY